MTEMDHSSVSTLKLRAKIYPNRILTTELRDGLLELGGSCFTLLYETLLIKIRNNMWVIMKL